MLLSLANRPQNNPEQTPLSALLSCHQRIRHFVELATKLAVHSGMGTFDSAQLAEAASATHRYFTVALPLHVQDEDQTLSAYLLAAPLSLAQRKALLRMNREHGPIEAAVAACAPLWETLVKDPTLTTQQDPGAFVKKLHVAAQTLADRILPHLQEEEEEVFPALGLVSPCQAAEILQHFHKRRAV